MNARSSKRALFSVLAVMIFFLSMLNSGAAPYAPSSGEMSRTVDTGTLLPTVAQSPEAGTQVWWNQDQNSTNDEWSWQNRNWLFGPRPTFEVYYHENGTLFTEESYAGINELINVVVTVPKGVFTAGAGLGRAEVRGFYMSNTMNFSANFYFNFETSGLKEPWFAFSNKYNMSGPSGGPSGPPTASFVDILPLECSNSSDASSYYITFVVRFTSETPLGLYQLDMSVVDTNQNWIGSYNYGSGWEFRGIAVGMPPSQAWNRSYGGSYTLQKLDMEGDDLYSISRSKDFIMRFNISGPMVDYVRLNFYLPSQIDTLVNVTGWYSEVVSETGAWEYDELLDTYVWNATISVSYMKQTYGPHTERRWVTTGTSEYINFTTLEYIWNNVTSQMDPTLVERNTWVEKQLMFIYNGTTESFESYYGYMYYGYPYQEYTEGTYNQDIMVLEEVTPDIPVLYELNGTLCSASQIGKEYVVDFVGHFTSLMPPTTSNYFSFNDLVMGPDHNSYSSATMGDNPRQTVSEYQMAKQIAIETPVTIAKILREDGTEPNGWMFQADKGDNFMVQGRLQGGGSVAEDIDGVQFIMSTYDSFWTPELQWWSELLYEIDYDMDGSPTLRAFNLTAKYNYTFGTYMDWAYVNVTGWHYEYDPESAYWNWVYGEFSEWRWMEVEGWHWQNWYYNQLTSQWQTEYLNRRSAETAISPDFCVTSDFNTWTGEGDLYASFLMSMNPTVPDSSYWWDYAFLNNTWYQDYAGSYGEHEVMTWDREWVYSFDYMSERVYLDPIDHSQLAFHNSTLSANPLVGTEVPYIVINGQNLPLKVRETYDPWSGSSYTNMFYFDHWDPATGNDVYRYELTNGTNIYVTYSKTIHIYNATTFTGDSFLTTMEWERDYYNGSYYNYFWLDIYGVIHEGGSEYYKSNLASFVLYDEAELTGDMTMLWYVRYGSNILKIAQYWWESRDNCYYMTDLEGNYYRMYWDEVRCVYTAMIDGVMYDITYPCNYYAGTYGISEVMLVYQNIYYSYYSAIDGTNYEMPYPDAGAQSTCDLSNTASSGGKVPTIKSVEYSENTYPVYGETQTEAYANIEGVSYRLNKLYLEHSMAQDTHVWSPVVIGYAIEVGTMDVNLQFAKVGTINYTAPYPDGWPSCEDVDGNYRYVYHLLNGTNWLANRSMATQVFEYQVNGSTFYSTRMYPDCYSEGNYTHYYYTALNGTQIRVPTWESLSYSAIYLVYMFDNGSYYLFDFMGSRYTHQGISGYTVSGFRILNSTYPGELFVKTEGVAHPIYEFTYFGTPVTATAGFESIHKTRFTWGYPVIYGPTPIECAVYRNFQSFIVGIPEWGMWGIKNWVMSPDDGALDLDGDLETTDDQYFVLQLYNSMNAYSHEWNFMQVYLTWNPNATMYGDEMNINSWLGLNTYTWSYTWSQTFYWFHAADSEQLDSIEMQQVKDIMLTPENDSRPGYWDIAWMARNVTWADIVAQAVASGWDWITSNEQSWTWLSFGISQDYGTTYTQGDVEHWLDVGVHYEFSGLMIWNDTDSDSLMDVDPMSPQGGDLSHYLIPDAAGGVEFVTPGMAYNNTEASGSIDRELTDEITWGVTFYDVNGTAYPYTLSGYWGWYDRMMTGVDLRSFDDRPTKVTIDELSFLVHFQGHLNVTSMNNYAVLKVDNYVGNWDVDMTGGRANLENRSLALSYLADVRMADFSFKANGSFTGSESTVAADTFELETAGARFAEMIMGGTTYDWSKNTTAPYDVVSCTTPAGTFRAAYESESSMSATGWAFSTGLYYVTIGFPHWDGCSVYQDPVFVGYVSNQGVQSGPGGVAFSSFTLFPTVPQATDSVTVTVQVLGAEGVSVNSVDLQYSTDQMTWTTTSMSYFFGSYQGQIPPHAEGVNVYYRVVAHTNVGDVTSIVLLYRVGQGAITTTQTITQTGTGIPTEMLVLVAGSVVVALIVLAAMRRRH
ncbi:MAG: hypothetical protein C4K49_05980 [Candidatus Thorarchaeota archaeon]|nr:MAG: hypothetical protein C4K49_05980 [Candidatus Thorarchaeota archaeon]